MKKLLLIVGILITVQTLYGQHKNERKTTIIEGYFDDEIPDTVRLVFYEQRIAGTAAGSILQTCVTQKGHFRFVLPMKGSFSYVTLYPYKHPSLAFDYIVKNGDSNFISVNMPKPESKSKAAVLHFSGHNSGAFKARYLLDSAYLADANHAPHFTFINDSLKKDVTYLTRKSLPTADIVNELWRKGLSRIKGDTDKEVYEILQTDCRFKSELLRLSNFIAYRKLSFNHADSTARLQILKDYFTTTLRNITDTIPVSKIAKSYSRYYMEYQCLKAIACVKVQAGKKELESASQLIRGMEGSDPAIRQKFIACTIADLGTYNDVSGKDSLIVYAMKRITDPFLHDIITAFYSKAMKGRDAFVFTLEDVNGKKVSLTDFNGKKVLLDFWFTGCFGCTQVAKGLKQVKDYFAGDTTVVFVSISADKEKSKWMEGLRSGLYTDGRGIDLYTMGQGFDNDITRYYFIDSYPRLMLIDPKGKLFAFNANRPGVPEANRLLIEQINSIPK